MARDAAKSSWEDNYHNKSISGIEIRDKNGKLVSFIAIKHDELLEKNTTHRVTIKLDENEKPILPPPQTFEEIIQAKRRQQMLLYGSGSSTTSTTLSDRAARRVAAAARQQSSTSQPSRRVAGPPLSRSTSRSDRSRSRSKKKKSGGKKAKPATSESKIEPKIETPKSTSERPASKQATSKTKVSRSSSSTSSSSANVAPGPAPSTSSAGVVTSMKDFKKNMPSSPKLDPKQVRMLLKKAPPGACVILIDGTVIKKSRRGGARVGAGRKRSRPLPASQQARGKETGGHKSSDKMIETNSSNASVENEAFDGASNDDLRTSTAR